jgi:hypothetical protein
MDRTSAFLAMGVGGVALVLALAAAAGPAALAQVSGGLWEIDGRPGAKVERLCIADVASLSQLEHRSSRCTRVIIRDLPTLTEIHYTCTGGGFGRSTLKVITPRSLRVETQGIAGGAPFNYVVQARRVGDCAGH